MDGDEGFRGVNMRLHPSVLPPGWVSEAINARFNDGVAETRKGLVRLGWLNKTVSTACTVTTASLPNGEVDAPYAGELDVDMQLPNVTWSLDSGTLPGGLTLNADGTITGTPTAPGVFTFTVKATPTP